MFFLRFLRCPRDPLRGSAWSRWKNPWFFAMSAAPAQPSARIGVVEVEKPMVFLRCLRRPRNPLRGSAWSRCKNPWFFAISAAPAQPSAGIGVVEVQKLKVFCNFCGARAMRELAWSRCKNPWFFAISAAPAQPSAGIGSGRGFFCNFCGARATLCGNWRGRGAKTRGFLRLLLFELVLGSCLVVRAPAPGTGGSRVRFLPGPRAGVARCKLLFKDFKATCAEQLAQSKLRRATCADQLAPTSLRRAPCLEQLAQSNLRRATYAEQLAHRNLHRAPCLVLSRACFTNASCREKERILQRWADLACDVLLSGQPWSSFKYPGTGPGRTRENINIFFEYSARAQGGPSLNSRHPDS